MRLTRYILVVITIIIFLTSVGCAKTDEITSSTHTENLKTLGINLQYSNAFSVDTNSDIEFSKEDSEKFTAYLDSVVVTSDIDVAFSGFAYRGNYYKFKDKNDMIYSIVQCYDPKDMFYLEDIKNDTYIFYSDELAHFLSSILGEPESQIPSMRMAKNRWFIDKLRYLIKGGPSIENFIDIIDLFEVSYSNKNKVYSFKVIFDKKNSYTISLKLGKKKLDRIFCYDTDKIVIQDDITGEEIINPEVSEFLMLMQEGQKDINKAENKYDIVKSDKVLLELIQYIKGEIPLGDMVNQPGWDFKNESYYKKICSVTQEFNIIIKPTDTGVDEYIDYSKMEILINDMTGGISLENPSVEKIQHFIHEPYLQLLNDLKTD